jgi:hypothetical protein
MKIENENHNCRSGASPTRRGAGVRGRFPWFPRNSGSRLLPWQSIHLGLVQMSRWRSPCIPRAAESRARSTRRATESTSLEAPTKHSKRRQVCHRESIRRTVMSKAIKILAITMATIAVSALAAFAQSPPPYSGGYGAFGPPPSSPVAPYGDANPSYNVNASRGN